MKGRAGLVVSGVVLALVLDTLRGRQRRDKVLGWIEPARQRVARTIGAVRQPSSGDAEGLDLGQTTRAAVDTAQEGGGNAAESIAANLKDLPLPGAQPEQQETPATEGQGQAGQQGTPKAAVQEHGATVPSMEGMEPQSISPEELAPQPVPDPIPASEPNDPTLVARVESELFRDQDLPKGALSIDAVNGVVTLRGTVDQETATDLIERTGAVEGVERVVDLLNRG